MRVCYSRSVQPYVEARSSPIQLSPLWPSRYFSLTSESMHILWDGNIYISRIRKIRRFLQYGLKDSNSHAENRSLPNRITDLTATMHSTNLPYSRKDDDRKFRPAQATRRFTKRSYALVGIIIIALLYYFDVIAGPPMTRGRSSRLSHYSTKSSKALGKDGKLRIAIVTMTTQQHSYSHVALSNKWGMSPFHDPFDLHTQVCMIRDHNPSRTIASRLHRYFPVNLEQSLFQKNKIKT